MILYNFFDFFPLEIFIVLSFFKTFIANIFDGIFWAALKAGIVIMNFYAEVWRVIITFLDAVRINSFLFQAVNRDWEAFMRSIGAISPYIHEASVKSESANEFLIF